MRLPYSRRGAELEVRTHVLEYRILESYLIDHKDILLNNYNYLGIWCDSSVGEYVFDISTVYGSHDMAVARAKDNNQIAIFDLINKQEIFV